MSYTCRSTEMTHELDNAMMHVSDSFAVRRFAFDQVLAGQKKQLCFSHGFRTFLTDCLAHSPATGTLYNCFILFLCNSLVCILENSFESKTIIKRIKCIFLFHLALRTDCNLGQTGFYLFKRIFTRKLYGGYQNCGLDAQQQNMELKYTL